MHALTTQAFVELIRYDAFMHRYRFADLHTRIHALPVYARRSLPNGASRISEAVARACIWHPKPVLCLQRSCVAVTLLRRYGIPAQMVIGAQRLPFKAHAWVEIDGKVVNDRPEVNSEYIVMERC
jgi:hypothetical protein